MINEFDNVEVDFDHYCNKCKFVKEDETFDECDECLNHPFNTNSSKPVNFKEKEK